MNIDKWDEYGLECDQHLYPELGAAFDVELADLLPVQAPCGGPAQHHHQYAQSKLRQTSFNPSHQLHHQPTHNSQRMFQQDASPPPREVDSLRVNQLSDEQYDTLGRSDPLLFDSSLLQQHQQAQSQFHLHSNTGIYEHEANPNNWGTFTSQLEGVEVPLGERLAELSKPDACDISVQLEYDYPPDYAPLDDHPHQSCVPIQEDPEAEHELIPIPTADPNDPDWEETARDQLGLHASSTAMEWDWSSNSNMSDESDDNMEEDFGSSNKKGNRRPRLANRSRQRIAANKRERSRMKVINKDDTGASSSDLAEQQSVIVYYTPVGEDPSQAVAHSLSWVKEPQMTGSCFPNIVPNERNGIIQTQRIRARVWYPALSERDSNTKGSVPVDLLPRPATASNSRICHAKKHTKETNFNLRKERFQEINFTMKENINEDLSNRF
ncbi:Oidioi.mRNA.OKI2018_I69.XSR.g14688.t1.cds [Oikopleura dioica]|uniref:Oidioi.mRNA.OKI2018_I69.XSR.g14688.t1.cds n=1 Tax=Oikopleura dioica TaxID=34765 RepID=A0ABN7SCB6_OIKDI|nr:Oidioi.mRNA.OKI2018_I69.XSR.g14688.t1.cds [Oikopleura dioica]